MSVHKVVMGTASPYEIQIVGTGFDQHGIPDNARPESSWTGATIQEWRQGDMERGGESRHIFDGHDLMQSKADANWRAVRNRVLDVV